MSIPVNSVPTERSALIVDGVLRQTKARLIRVTLSVAACLWLAGTILFALGFVVADHLIDGGVPTWARFILLGMYLAAVFAGATALILLACVRRVGDAYTAHLLEQNHEGFHNSLINAVQLHRREDLPGSLVAALLARAALDAGRCDVGRAVTLRRAALAGVAAAVAMLLLVGYAAVAPKSVLQSMLRAFGAPLPAPTRTFIVHMTPGDGASVLMGRAVTFSACLGGRNPREVTIDFSADGGVTILSGQRLGLVPIGASDTERRQHLWEGTKAGQDIQQTMHWRATAGDAVSGWRRLVVRPAPDVTELRVRCEYPAYTGMEPRTIEPGRPADIDAVVGTQVTIEAVTNVPIRDPVLVVTTGAGPENETRLPMQVIDEEKRRAGGTFTVIEDGRYCLRFFDLFGEPNADPIHHAIRARPDNPPAITVARPAGDLELDADASLSLDARVEDDFGITRLAIEYKRRGQGGSLSVPVEPPEGRTAARSCDVRIAIPLSRFTARAGDTIEWQLVAWDNRTGTHGQPAAQEGRGPLRRIRVRESQQFAQAEQPNEGEQRSAKSDLADRPGNDATDDQATSQPTERNEDSQAGQQLARAEARDAGELDRFIEQHRDELARLREQLAEAKGDAESEGSEPERKGSSDAPQTEPGRAGPDPENEPKNAANAPNDGSRDAGTAAKGAKPKDADDDTPTSEAPASSEDAKSSDTPGRPEGPERQRQQTTVSDANIDQPNPQQADATGAFENPGAGDGTGSGRTTDAQGESGRGPGLQQGSAEGTPGTGQHAGRGGHGPGRSAEGSRGRDESGAGTETGDGASPGEAQRTGSGQSDRPGDEHGSQQARGGGWGQPLGQSAERSGGGSGSAPDTETGEKGSPGRPQGDAQRRSGRSGSGGRGQKVVTDGARDVGQQAGSEGRGEGAQPSSEGSGGKSGAAPGQEDGGEGTSNGPSGNNAEEPGRSGERSGQRHSDDGTGDAGRQAESSGRGRGLKPSLGESRGGAQGTRSEQSDQSVSGEAKSDSEGAEQGQGSGAGTSAGQGEQGKGQTGESGSAGSPGSADITAGDGKADGPEDAASNTGKPSNKPGGTGTTPGGGGSGGPMAPDGSTDDTPPATQPEQPSPPAASPRPSTTGDVLPVIDALEERLRNKELDPKLLERLGWDEQRAAEFIREFRRAERRQQASGRSDPPSSSFQTSTRPTVEVRRSRGTGAGVAPLSARNLRTPDSTGRLFESGRQRISEEYRDLLSAYYETLARERPTATRPVK